jgi:HNH endonuclease
VPGRIADAALELGASPNVLEFTYNFTGMVLPNILGGASSTLSSRKQDFKEELCEQYDCKRNINGNTWVRCLLLDIPFPQGMVTAAHLFRRSNEYIASMLMHIDNIDDPRNGMLLFKPLEEAFNHLQISFLSQDAGRSFYLKLFDEGIRNTKLLDFMKDPNQRAAVEDAVDRMGCAFDKDTTFGKVDGRFVKFGNLFRPYNRCLNLQARIAYIKAVKKGCTDQTFTFSDFWSENMSLGDKMELFRKSLDENYDRIGAESDEE